MRARGIDPGDTIGWCDIERESAGVFRFIACGTWEAKDFDVRVALPFSPLGVDIFSVETPREMHVNDIIGAIQSATRAAKHAGSPITTGVGAGAGRIVQTVRNLLETRALAERIACGIVAAGGRVVEPTAAECRAALGVKFGAQRGRGEKLTPDQQLAEIIPLAVRGWPKRSNPHHRDAAAAAIRALSMPLGAA